MRSFQRVAWCGMVLVLACSVGCASTKISDRENDIAGEKIPSPDRIIVHDFVVRLADLPPGSALVDESGKPEKPMTEEEQKAGRALGAAVAKELVKEIDAMAMQAVRAEGAAEPAMGDIAIYGAFITVDEGSGFERVVVGFGAGDASVDTFVEGFLMTAEGMRRLGSGQLDSAGGKGPGVVVPLVVTIATANPIGLVVGGAVKAYGELSGSSKLEGAGKRTAAAIAKQLKIRFEQQGWISDN